DERARRKMDDGGEQACGHRDGQPDEVLLVNLRSPFRERARARRLHVKSREPERAADEEHEGEEPAELVHLAPPVEPVQRAYFAEGRPVAPRVDEGRGRDPERQNVGYRVELNPDLGRGLREPRDPAVERVEEYRPPDR